MLKLLVNTLAKSFYQQHAGFFLVGIYILFGVVEPSQLMGYQKALLLSGITSPVGMAIVFTSWFLYSLKVLFFVRQKLAEAQYSYVRETAALHVNMQLKLWLKLFLVMLLPIGVYVVLLIVLSFKYHLFWSALSIVFVFTLLCVILSWLTFRSVTFGFLKRERRSLSTGIQVKRPYFSWPIFHLLNEQPLMLLMCKGLSFIFFKGMLWMFADADTDERVVLVGLLASVLCHAVLIYSLLKFEISYLNFVKSMPVPVFKRVFNWLLIFAIILIPEWIFAMMASHSMLYTFFTAFLFGLASLHLMLTILNIVKLDMDRYLKYLLFFFFIAMWAILVHYGLLFSVLLLVSCSFYYLQFFNKTDLKAITE
ncbi:hypothetical protein OC25_25835 [Pedobacter kyungheensis]|uniref:Uncharacterized protein n=1 Tax=Pedobacter kyungheensis TaxID=1069985 RepID=A0A0C1D564_9SPHI|nr:hypothetical protein [Pedobacter kyungheensis]KIA88915.1 hypothetical protein OC25_25835 [Pedobacter kyungheensis]